MRDPRSFPVESIWRFPAVDMITAPNPGPKTLSGTHAYAVGCDSGYLIDPGPLLPSYLDALATWSRERFHALQGILLTHAHPDHAPGASRLAGSLSVPVLACEAMPTADRQHLHVDQTFRPGDAFELDGDMLDVVATPGHTPDHVSFWLEQSRILFSGDTVLGEGTTLIAPPEGNMAAYMRTLETIRALHPMLIAPGHGPLVREPDRKLEAYVRHRHEREAQLLRALADGPATAEELVSKVYTDVNPELHRLALGSVLAQLEKLQTEGGVVSEGETYELAQQPYQ